VSFIPVPCLYDVVDPRSVNSKLIISAK